MGVERGRSVDQESSAVLRGRRSHDCRGYTLEGNRHAVSKVVTRNLVEKAYRYEVGPSTIDHTAGWYHRRFPTAVRTTDPSDVANDLVSLLAGIRCD